ADALRHVPFLDRNCGSTAKRGKENQRAKNLRAEAGRKTMIRTENLRSGYIQDDVEGYVYQLLPERDAVVTEIEDYAAQNRVPIIGPAVARMLTLFVQVSGAKRIFEMGSAQASPRRIVHYRQHAVVGKSGTTGRAG